MRACLDSFFDEAQILGAEVIVVDNNGRGLPTDAGTRYPGVVSLSESGAPVHRLRSLGMAQASGEVVALTEDHCRAWPGWCRGHAEAHRAHPEVAVVGGRVENGTPRRLFDWANFLVNHARFMAPVESGERQAVDYANLSYKRRVLPAEASELGMDEPALPRMLHERGERLFLDGEIAVFHDQSLGPLRTLLHHFHAGRAIAGFARLRGMGTARSAGAAARALGVPPVFLFRTLRAFYDKRRFPARALASLPIEAVLLCSATAGLCCGYLFGPGTSPRHLH